MNFHHFWEPTIMFMVLDEWGSTRILIHMGKTKKIE